MSLMGKSPYLSDSVLIATIEKEDILPNVIIKDILAANPQSAKSPEIMNKVEEKTIPMTPEMIAEILLGKYIVAAKEKLESELSAYKLQRAKAFNGLVRWFMNDTLNPVASSDSLVQLFQQDNALNSKYNLAFLHMERGELQTGLDVLNGIPIQFNLLEVELTNHQEIVNYCNLLVDLANGDKSVLEVDSIQMNQLLTMEAMEQGQASVYARNILLALNEIDYDEPILMPDLLKSSQAFKVYQELISIEPPKQIEVYPNPSDDYVIISYKLEMEKPGYSVRITDLNGKTIKTIDIINQIDQVIIDTHNWIPGVYIGTLELNGNSTESVKFTIF